MNIDLVCKSEIVNNRKIPYGEVCYKCKKKAKAKEIIKGKWTGKYLCTSHYNENYDCNIRKLNPGSNHNIVKTLTGIRTGFLNPNSNSGKSIKFQKLTCSVFDVDDLNIVNDNYTSPIDHSRHPVLGILQTQGRLFQIYIGDQGGWGFSNMEREWSKIFDHMILWCTNKDCIERGYIIPKKEIYDSELKFGRKSISIVKMPSKGVQWYDRYCIKDEELLKKINELWTQILKEKIV